MVEKRKHVVFAADESVHPSRRVAVDGPAPLSAATGEPKAPKVSQKMLSSHFEIVDPYIDQDGSKAAIPQEKSEEAQNISGGKKSFCTEE